jgi:hypothetical protein
MKHWFSSALAAFVLFASNGAAQQPAGDGIPDYLNAEKSCAIILKLLPQADAAAGRMEAARFWDTVNVRIVGHLLGMLDVAHRVTALEIAYADREQLRTLAGIALAKGQCNRLLQLSHQVDQDAQGPYFTFTFSILRMVPERRETGGTTVVTRGEFLKSYRHARTSAVMDSFMMDGFARQVFADLEAAGALAALRRQP